LPQTVLDRADNQAYIPMLGEASSLNMAVAAGLLLYEAAHNRPTAGPVPG
jgi:tRNA G18 (ribose-2'-O)-methylase SpoU